MRARGVCGGMRHPEEQEREDPMRPTARFRRSSTVEAAERLRCLTPRQRREILLFGRNPDPVPSFTGLIEPAEPGKTGIACAGSGIRSASFSLGALQALQHARVLQASRYLAGVSGGAYIASAFAMVRKTWTGPEKPSAPEPGWDDSDPDVLATGEGPFHPGSPEAQYLRNRSSYLAPGFAGKVRLGYRLALGLAINLGFIALFIAIVSMLLAMAYGAIFPQLAAHVDHHHRCVVRDCAFVPLHLPPATYLAPIAVAGLALLSGLVSVLCVRVGPGCRELTWTWSVRGLGVAIACGALLVGIPVLLALVRSAGTVSSLPAKHAAGGTAPGALAVGAAGVVTAGSAILLQLRTEWMKAATLADGDGRMAEWWRRFTTGLRRAITFVLAILVGPGLVLFGALAVMTATLNREPVWQRWACCAAFTVLFALLYAAADLTTWSLHPFYRERLCSAFALKRVALPDGVPPISADTTAGIAVARDYDRMVLLSGSEAPGQWPELIVCAAANVSDDAATPPGRSVTSFTFSARRVGGPLVGQVATCELEDRCQRRQKAALTLPAAVAMSGAAISPAMGKKTRRRYRFLLALANVRLGVWVPNPRWAARMRADGRMFGRPRPSHLLRELLGVNPINGRFLYVTDGGHYDSTGIVELLRRGCTTVYCFDAGDGTLDALSDAVSLARSELGVEIAFAAGELAKLTPGEGGRSESDFVTATISYPGGVRGTLRYARPSLTGDAPADAAGYRRRDPRFPNDALFNQLYTDERFEAYRVLGARAAQNMLAPAASEPSAVATAGR